MNDGMQLRRLGTAIDKLFAYKTRAKSAAVSKAGKQRSLATKKHPRPKQSPARG